MAMPFKVSQEDVWVAGLRDRPGALAKKLGALADAGVQLEFVIARRTPEKRNAGVVFVTPIRGASRQKAAKKAGFRKTRTLCSLRVEGPDKQGRGAQIAQALADAGLNLRGLSGAVIGKRFVTHLAFDKAADAANAARVLRRLR